MIKITKLSFKTLSWMVLMYLIFMPSFTLAKDSKDEEIRLLKEQIDLLKKQAMTPSLEATNNWKPFISCLNGLKFERAKETHNGQTTYREYCFRENADNSRTRVGNYVLRFETGELYSKSQYNSNGLAAGKFIGYHKNGKEYVHATLIDGKFNGEYEEYDESGSLIKKIFYKNDVVVSGIKNQVLTIKKLKVYQLISNIAKIDFQITNNSSGFIKYWKINAAIYNKDGVYQAGNFTNGQNLKSGDSVIKSISYSEVSIENIERWEPKIGNVTITIDGRNFEAGSEFTIVER